MKYRAWDYINNEMVYSDRGNANDCFYVNDRGVLFMYKIPKSDNYYKTYDIMEWTKIDDVFDLDVIELTHSFKRHRKGEKFVVFYDSVHNRFGACFFDDYGAEHAGFRSHFFITAANAKKFKVVSNLIEMEMNKTTNRNYS